MIFSVYPTIIDFVLSIFNVDYLGVSTIGMYGSQSGYTIVNFVCLYLITGYLRKYEINLSKIFCFVGFITIALIIIAWSYVDGTAWAYCNPLIIIESMLIFMIFKQIKLKNIYTINLLSKASFFVYLTHDRFLFLIHGVEIISLIDLLLLEIGFAMLLYVVGFIAYLIYELFFGRLMKKISTLNFFKFDIKDNQDNVRGG